MAAKTTKIAVTNAKGGVAKTTTAINLADGLMHIGYNVLFIDLDPQANSTSIYTKNTEREPDDLTLFDLMRGCLAQERLNIDAYIKSTEFGDIILGDRRLRTIDSEIISTIGGNKIIYRILKQIDGMYDYVIMDTPPNIGAFMRNALYAADGCICPVLPKKFAMDGLKDLIDTINMIKYDGNENLDIYGILLTVYDKRNSQDKMVKQMLPEIGKELRIRVFDTVIRTSQNVEKSLSRCQKLFDYYSQSAGASDYANFIKELLDIIS